MRKATGVFVLMALVATLPAHADDLASRLDRLDPQPTQLFHSPRDAFDTAAYQAGSYYHWIRYGKSQAPKPEAFRGYSLFSDPFHTGLSRISFLLGSDCSHFVHRLFQLLGAEYPYLKTRHLIAYLLGESKPQDLSECRWKQLTQSFEKVGTDTRTRREGDLWLWAHGEGEWGEHGHVAVVVGRKAEEILHARSSSAGIVREKPGAEAPVGALRWKGPLRALSLATGADLTLDTLLRERYAADPSGCAQ